MISARQHEVLGLQRSGKRDEAQALLNVLNDMQRTVQTPREVLQDKMAALSGASAHAVALRQRPTRIFELLGPAGLVPEDRLRLREAYSRALCLPGTGLGRRGGGFPRLFGALSWRWPVSGPSQAHRSAAAKCPRGLERHLPGGGTMNSRNAFGPLSPTS